MKTPDPILLPSSARSRGRPPLAPAGEARPRVRSMGSARQAGGGWVAGTLAGRLVCTDTPAPLGLTEPRHSALPCRP